MCIFDCNYLKLTADYCQIECKLKNIYPKKIGPKLLLFLVLFTASVQLCSAQLRIHNSPNSQTHALSIGDIIPESLWNLPLQVVNNPEGKSTVNLADYKGKLILLDFWSTWCSPCIAFFPIMHALQKRVGKDMVVLAVTPENKSKITKFFQNGAGKSLQYVQSVINDSALSEYFPHNGYPHIAWISPSGSLINTTRADEVTFDHVDAVLHNHIPAMTSKIDIDQNRPLFLSRNFSDDLILQARSMFIKGAYMGLPSGNNYQLDQDGNIIGRKWTNLPMMDIYYPAAYEMFKRKGEKFRLKRVIKDVKAPEQLSFIKIGPQKFDKSNLYSYELILPKDRVDSLFDYMLSDLNRYSDYTTSFERRKVKCLELVRTSDKDLIKTKGGKRKNSFPATPSVLRNFPLSFMIGRLNGANSLKMPLIIDGTGYTGNVDIEISEVKSLKQLKAELNKYDLDLIPTEKELLMFVIKDK